MNIFEKVLEFFRKKEYYIVDYENLNTFSISFKELNENDLHKIKKVLFELNESLIIDDISNKLYKKDALEFSNIDSLLNYIKETIFQDYRKTYFEANNNGWDFLYFVTDNQPIYKNSIFVSIKISSLNKDIGEVIYPLLVVKKHKIKFYFWNLIEEYDGIIDNNK